MTMAMNIGTYIEMSIRINYIRNYVRNYIYTYSNRTIT